HEYQKTLIKHWIAKDTIPPRLLHWLLQLEMALWSHPKHMDRLLAMREAVLEAPGEYEEYQIMAIKGESLSQVMRPDLSESEGMQQIAVSASCNCDPELEDPLIDELRQKVQRWQRGSQAKIKALVKQIQEFWWDFPQEKVLVFAGHAIAVREIAEALQDALGDKTVCTFGAHQEQLEREEAARSFQRNDAVSVMVSDPLGGEGRNFQFVSAIAHFDLPWNIASVEQRIGRVDRLGRDGDVPSWIMCPEGDNSMLSAWGHLLDEAVGVFDNPASGLEFISDTIEEKALIAGLTQGAQAIIEMIPEVQDQVAVENKAAEASSEELYTGQGEDFKTAAKLAAAVDQVKAPVKAVCNWIRGMGGQVRRDDSGVMPFHLRLPRADDYVDGVFERNKALANPELSYFAQGHQVVDLLIDDASRASWCQAMAWRRQPQTALKKWEGLRISFELQLDLAPLVAAKLPIESLRRIYCVTPPRRLLRFMSFPDGELVEDRETISILKKPFDNRNGDSCLSPKTSRELWMRPMLEGKLQQIVDWQGRIDHCMGLAGELGA
ncbi:MAG: hypothetical protein HRU15_06350, partial [Planctomycetes bacterium]|nr:hypothetical protein [Planctomycetota bacterium]